MFSVSPKTKTHRNSASKHYKPASILVAGREKEESHPVNTTRQRNHAHRISTQGLGDSNHLEDIARPEKHMLQNGNIAELLVNFEKESDTKGKLFILYSSTHADFIKSSMLKREMRLLLADRMTGSWPYSTSSNILNNEQQ